MTEVTCQKKNRQESTLAHKTIFNKQSVLLKTGKNTSIILLTKKNIV